MARPQWYQGLAWQVSEHGLLWRAEETELVIASPVKPGGVLCTDPELTEAWLTGWVLEAGVYGTGSAAVEPPPCQHRGR